MSSNRLDWIIQEDKPLLPATVQPNSGLEVTYDMAIASQGIEATELDTIPAELMDIFFK